MTIPPIINQETRHILQGIPYFQGLDREALDVVAQEMVVRHFKAGEIVFLANDTGAGLHLVVEGTCKVYYLSPEGREHILYILEPGDFCNEVSAVDGGPNPANFAAIDDSIVWVVTRVALLKLRNRYPVLNEVVIVHLAKHCRQLVQRVYDLSFRSVTGRLARFLLEHSDTHNQLNRSRWTQEEIAAYLGTVREMVARSFKELRQTKLIKFNRYQIEILDREGLRDLQEL